MDIEEKTRRFVVVLERAVGFTLEGKKREVLRAAAEME